jgi:hypothetical protein
MSGYAFLLQVDEHCGELCYDTAEGDGILITCRSGSSYSGYITGVISLVCETGAVTVKGYYLGEQIRAVHHHGGSGLTANDHLRATFGYKGGLAVDECGDGVTDETGGEFTGIMRGIDTAITTYYRIGAAVYDSTEGLYVT